MVRYSWSNLCAIGYCQEKRRAVYTLVTIATRLPVADQTSFPPKMDARKIGVNFRCFLDCFDNRRTRALWMKRRCRRMEWSVFMKWQLFRSRVNILQRVFGTVLTIASMFWATLPSWLHVCFGFVCSIIRVATTIFSFMQKLFSKEISYYFIFYRTDEQTVV